MLPIQGIFIIIVVISSEGVSQPTMDLQATLDMAWDHVSATRSGSRSIAPWKAGSARPRGVGRGYLGWPGTPFAGLARKERGVLLRETFLPSEWWLRLYYGLGIDGAVYYHRLLKHPTHVAAHFMRLVRRRLDGRRKKGDR